VHGYAATARIEHVQPHRVGVARAPEPAVDASVIVEADPVEIAGRPFGQRWADFAAHVRVTWAQTTFFLFDPESWR
jgi:hypothetical protein